MSKQTLWTTVAVTFAFASWPLAAILSGGQILPGLPIAREPHHHLVFQNEYVKVYEVEVGPHSATLEHQHGYDNLFVAFGEAHLANRVTGRQETHVDLADLAVNFSRAPYSHVIRNEAGRPFRNITIELLRPQGDLEKYDPSLDAALAAIPERGRSVRQATVLETQEMRLRAVSVSAGSSWSVPHDGREHLLVRLDKIHNAGTREANSAFPAGMVVWISAGHDWNIYRAGRQDMKIMVLDFADSRGKNTFGDLQQVGRQSTLPHVQ
jgi:hypothetical protein